MPVDGDIILKAGLNTKPVKSALDDLHKSVNKGFKNLLRYGLGVRSMYALIRKLRKALTEGFGDLAQVSEPFNTAMSSIKNALAGLKSSFAAAFAPIIEFVAPALTTFINMVAKAVDAVGMLIAALTGKKEYIKAIPVQQDYAASVDKTAKSAKRAKDNLDDASNSAKKLHRQLAGFDDVEILKEPNESGSGSSGSGGADSGLSSVQTPLSEAFTSLSDLLKKAWQDSDFYDIGRIVGEKIRDALLNIPWTKIKEVLKKIATSAATFLNGYFETPGLFATIGITIAQAINSAFVFLYNFISNFHWDSYGIAIRTRLTSALNNIEWGLVYKTFAGFGTGLAQYLNELFKPETFESVGTTVGHLLNAAFEFLNNFGDTFNFKQFGTSLARGINQFLRTFDVNRLAYGINKFVTGFSDAIIAFMSNVNWYDLGLKIRNLLVKIDWNAALVAVGKFIWQALNASVLTLSGIFDTNNIESPITDALGNLQRAIDDVADDINFDLLREGFDSLKKVLGPVGEGFAAGFIDFFSILAEIGIGLINALGPAFQAIADALGELEPETLEAIGRALGAITAALVTINGLTAVAGIIHGVAGAVGKVIGIGGGAAAAGSAAAGAAGGAAAGGGLIGLASRFKGLIPVVGKAAGAVGAFIVANEAMLVDLSETDVFYDTRLLPSYNAVSNAVSDLTEEYDLSTEQMSIVIDSLTTLTGDAGPGAVQTFDQLREGLERAGIPADDFLASITSILKTNPDQNAQRVVTALEEMGTAASTSAENTGELEGAFNAFDGLSITTPLKMALLQAAIHLLGKSNEDVKGKSEDLFKVLDTYDPKHPEDAMDAIQKAFEESGVSVEEFDSAVQKAAGTMSTDLSAMGFDVAKDLTNIAENGLKGYIDALDDGVSDVKNSSKNIGENTTEPLKENLQENSPSKKMYTIGQYAIQGLINGIKQKETLLTNTMRTLTTSIIKLVESTYSQFSTAGQQIINRIYTGMSGSVGSVTGLVYSLIASIQSSFYSMDWYSIGSNIGNGIYNGLANSANRLAVLAWNVAVNMFNSARNALGIHSPSKKFAWIGEMVSTGLGEGVEDKASVAVAKLQTLLTTLENLGSATTIPMPDVAMGMVTPYSVSNSSKDSQSLSSVTDAVKAMHSDALTRDDIVEIVNTAMRNFTVDLYIGDEQIARHANNGNLKLSRRYGTVT